MKDIFLNSLLFLLLPALSYQQPAINSSITFSEIVSPRPVYGHASVISSQYNLFITIGGTLAKSTNGSFWQASNQFAQLNYVGTVATWKLNNNPKLPTLVNTLAFSVNSGRDIYFVFGMLTWSNNSFNEDYAVGNYNPSTGEVKKVVTVPPVGSNVTGAPDYRAANSAGYDPVTNQIFVYGGIEKSGTIVKDMWILNLTDLRWRVVKENANTHPVPLGTHGYVAGDYFVVCFGNNGARNPPINTCTLFQISTLQWVTSPPSKIYPQARSASRTIFIPPSTFLIHGGMDFSTGDVFNDIWTLDITKFPNQEWKLQTPTGYNFPSSRLDHTLSLADKSTVLFFGGRNGSEGSDPFDTSIYALNTEKWTWNENWAGIAIPKSPDNGFNTRVAIIVVIIVAILVTGGVTFGVCWLRARRGRLREEERVRKGKYILSSGSMDLERNRLLSGKEGYDIPHRSVSKMHNDKDYPPAYSMTNTHVAKRDFYPKAMDELEVVTGDELVLLETYTDGWVKGENRRSGTIGMFPLTVVVGNETTETLDRNEYVELGHSKGATSFGVSK